SNFETVPDAPISSFEASFPEGPHSVVTTEYPGATNLCKPTETVTTTKRVTRKVHGHLRRVTVKTKKVVTKPLTAPTTIVGQNGKVVKQTTKVSITECGTKGKQGKVKTKSKKKKPKKKK
ncbi:MAG TPA: hypothetical protein VKV16_09065, partial [Solirubrobacteraceae bacterium]|nr:hypothetical protein [Solirubrobacteraceae bacterium]